MTSQSTVVANRPCLILAVADPTEANCAGRLLRCQGWDVYQAQSGPEARRLTRMLEADHVVLGTSLPGESGWLTCDKLKRERPEVKVILIDPNPAERADAYATFVGADAVIASVVDLAQMLPARPAAASLIN